jgi:hypothetical protein
VIYKKGNVEKRKKEAKEAGKGQFYFGVVDGKGPAIRFVLPRKIQYDARSQIGTFALFEIAC